MEIPAYRFNSSFLMQVNPFSKKTTWEITTTTTNSFHENINNLSIFTQNVWFDSAVCADQRYKAIIHQIESLNCDIVCLQEVTANFMENATKNKFIQRTYYLSDYKLTTFDAWYGVLLLVRKPFLNKFTKLPFPYSNMGRSLICAHLKSGDITGIIGTAHFESGDGDIEIRKRQWTDSTEYIAKENSNFSFICGDYNIYNDEFETYFLVNQLKWNDAWLQPDANKLLKDLVREGITFGSFQPGKILQNRRLDRILYCSKNPVVVECIKTYGDEPLESCSFAAPLVIHQSDHLGVFGLFKMS